MNNWTNQFANPPHSAGVPMSMPGQEQNSAYMMQQTLAGFTGNMPTYKGGMGPQSAMSDEQLYNLVMSLKSNNPSIALPPGMHLKQPSFTGGSGSPGSALEAAMAAASAKDGQKIEQGDSTGTGTGTGSSEEDRNSDGTGKSKRVLANRQSAHRSRLRKLQYIQDLENNVNRIQAEIANLQPQLNALRSSYLDASAQNNKLREAVNELLADARRKEARNSSLRQEAKDLLSQQGSHGQGTQDAHSLFASHSNPLSRQFSGGQPLFGSASNPITTLPQMH